MELLARGQVLTADSVARSIEMVKTGAFRPSEVFSDALLVSRTKSVRPKTVGQKRYVDAMRTHTIVFAIGPPGTGKTYLAVASAIQARAQKEDRRVTRPAGQSGFVSVQEILDGIYGLSFARRDDHDVVRHKIVQQIVEAYRKHDDASRDAERSRVEPHGSAASLRREVAASSDPSP